jgi:hypothetical protein
VKLQKDFAHIAHLMACEDFYRAHNINNNDSFVLKQSDLPFLQAFLNQSTDSEVVELGKSVFCGVDFSLTLMNPKWQLQSRMSSSILLINLK